jgi:galactonate dehydratase
MEVDIDRIAWDHELFSYAPQFLDGQLVLPDRPGWGTEPLEAALRAHPPTARRGIVSRAANDEK